MYNDKEKQNQYFLDKNACNKEKENIYIHFFVKKKNHV